MSVLECPTCKRLWGTTKALGSHECVTRHEMVYWLLRAYQSGNRDGWEAGPTTDETMDGLLDLLVKIEYRPHGPKAIALLKEFCPECKGGGWLENNYECNTCNGAGEVKRDIGSLKDYLAPLRGDMNRCIRHNTWPDDHEPCWGCVNERFGDGGNERLKEILQRGQGAYDQKLGYTFAERPSWNDMYYVINLLNAAHKLIRELTDLDDCRYDHNNLCQAHSLDEKPCPHERARKVTSKINR